MTENDIQLKKKMQLYRLIAAKDSINSSRAAISTAIQLGVDENHPLFNSLTEAAINSYGRAFTIMRPFGTLPKKWSHFQDEEHQKAHNFLMNLRHTSVSHADHSTDKIIVYPAGVQRRGAEPSQWVSYEVKTTFLAPQEFGRALSLFNDLEPRLDQNINELLKDIYEDGRLLIEPTELFSAEDLKQLDEINKRKDEASKKPK